MQLDWSHILKELMFFSCWKTFEMSLAGLFAQEISFCVPGSHQHWSDSVYHRERLGYSKAEHYKPALSGVQEQGKLLLLQVRAALLW